MENSGFPPVECSDYSVEFCIVHCDCFEGHFACLVMWNLLFTLYGEYVLSSISFSQYSHYFHVGRSRLELLLVGMWAGVSICRYMPVS